MPEVFINYRTGDGDETAVVLEDELTKRFGKGKIFRAATGIRPGDSFGEALLDAVRGSSVLIALIGPGWASHPLLREQNDWVRREILEAFASSVRVLPVLRGRKTDRLKAAELPGELSILADVQSRWLDTRDNEADIRRIGDDLADLVPALKRADQDPPRSADRGGVQNSARQVRGTVVQARDVGGDAGTVIKGSYGPVHTGRGNINQDSPRFTGDNSVYVKGDNHGEIRSRLEKLDQDKD